MWSFSLDRCFIPLASVYFSFPLHSLPTTWSSYIQYVNLRLDQPIFIVFLNSIARLRQSLFYCSVIFSENFQIRSSVNPDSLCLDHKPALKYLTYFSFQFNRLLLMPTCFFPFWSEILGFYFMVVCFVTPSNSYWVLSVRLLPSVPPNVKLLLSFFLFKEREREREIHVHSGVIFQCLCPSIWRNFFKYHGTCFMKPVHAPGPLVRTGTEDSVFFWKVFTEKQNKTGSATL